jgi:hypothetical protein
MYGRAATHEARQALGLQSSWGLLDASNAASFHGLLAYSAIYMCQTTRRPLLPRAIYHQMKAIQLINEWLADPVQATNDAVIAAVLRQLTIEV